MRVLVQRVTAAWVMVGSERVGEIAQGLTLLVGISSSDTPAELVWMAHKCLNLRVFSAPGSDRLNLSIQDIRGELLVVSQFTLYGNCQKGRRPSFEQAASPAIAEPLFEQFVTLLKDSGLRVQTGRFGADMTVHIQNQGPVTLWLEREATHL